MTKVSSPFPTSIARSNKNGLVKVLHLVHNLEREGAQVVLKNIITNSKSDNYEHLVCAWKRSGPLKKDFEEYGVRVFIVSELSTTPKIKHILSTINNILIEESVDILQAHMSDSAFLGAILSSPLCTALLSLPNLSKPIILLITHHSNKLTPSTGIRSFFWYVLLFWSAKKADKHIAISKSVQQNVVKKLCLKAEKVSIILNGVPIPSLVHSEENFPLIQNNSLIKAPIIVLIGRLIALKGISQFIKATKRIQHTFPNVKMYIIGEGHLREQLQREIDNLLLTNVVHLTGSTSNVSSWLEKADVFVSTSHYEGVPMSILEAMAWRVPIVASNVIGTRDIVHEGQTGLLYPLNDIEALSQKVISCLTQQPQTTQRVKKALQLVINNYSAEHMSNNYQSLYLKALSHE